MLFSVKVKFAECVIIVQSAFILFLNFFIGVVLRMSQAKVAFDLTFKGHLNLSIFTVWPWYVILVFFCNLNHYGLHFAKSLECANMDSNVPRIVCYCCSCINCQLNCKVSLLQL